MVSALSQLLLLTALLWAAAPRPEIHSLRYTAVALVPLRAVVYVPTTKPEEALREASTIPGAWKLWSKLPSRPNLPRSSRKKRIDIESNLTLLEPSFRADALQVSATPHLPEENGPFSPVSTTREVLLGSFADQTGQGGGLGNGGGNVLVPVRIIWKPRPIYTEEARFEKVEGEVIVDAEFCSDGTVRVVGLIQRLGHGLDETAVRAVKAIRFKPASLNRQAIDVRARAHVEFHVLSQPLVN